MFRLLDHILSKPLMWPFLATTRAFWPVSEMVKWPLTISDGTWRTRERHRPRLYDGSGPSPNRDESWPCRTGGRGCLPPHTFPEAVQLRTNVETRVATWKTIYETRGTRVVKLKAIELQNYWRSSFKIDFIYSYGFLNNAIPMGYRY